MMTTRRTVKGLFRRGARTAALLVLAAAAGVVIQAHGRAAQAALPQPWTQIPGGGITNLAPATTAFRGAVNAFVTATDGHVFRQSYDMRTGAWEAGWTELPGGGVLNARPSATSSADTIYVLGRGLDNQVWYTYREVSDTGNPNTWAGWFRLPAGEAVGPVSVVATNNGSLRAFRVDPNRRVWMATMSFRYYPDGSRARVWGSWQLVGDMGGYQWVPSVAYDPLSNTVHLITGTWEHSGYGLAHRALRDGAWSNVCALTHPDVFSIALGVGMAVDDKGVLYVFRDGGDGRMRAQIYGGACGVWGGSFTMRGNGTTDAAPAATAVDGGAKFVVLVKARGATTVWASAYDPVNDQVAEVTTRGHFSESDGRLQPGHNTYDYSTAGRIPGVPMGADCPRDLAIVVHGWTNPPASGQQRFQSARESLAHNGFPRSQVIGFSWDSDTGTWGNARGFDVGKANANNAARKLAAFIDDYKNVCRSTKVHLMGHSLGTRVVLEAVLALATDGWYLWNNELAGVIVDDVHLLGAAVDNERPQTNDVYGRAIQAEVGRLNNYYSSEDDILEFAYPAEEGDWALGEDGIEDVRRAPANFAEYEVKGELPNGGNDHYGYWGYLNPDHSLQVDGAMNWVRRHFT